MSITTLLGIGLILFVVGYLGFRSLQRSFFYPSPSEMPPTVHEDVQTALRRLEAALTEHCPGVLSSLQPGLSDDEISAIEGQHGLKLTDDLKALYRWRNGTPRDAKLSLIPGMRFLPLQEAVQGRDDLRRQVAGQSFGQRLMYEVFAGHRTGWMTVLDDGAGDGYFYDQARVRSGGYFFFNFAEVRQYRFFPSLANFLVGAAECYEKLIYRCDREGQAREDHEASYALWPHYASSPGVD